MAVTVSRSEAEGQGESQAGQKSFLHVCTQVGWRLPALINLFYTPTV